MRKHLVLFFMITLLMLVMVSPSLAEGTNTTTTQQDTITQQPTTTKQDTTNQQPTTNNSFLNGLNNASNLSANVTGAEKITSGVKTIASFIVQVLAYVITFGIAVRVVLDLTYIGLPFTRSLLSNGHSGVAQHNNTFGGGYNNTFGGGYNTFGGGGFGNSFGGYGANRFGVHGSTMGKIGGLQLVSNAALNAVASESAVDPNGKTGNAFKTYTKDMVVLLVMVPVLLTLTITGALSNIGYYIGSLIVNMLHGINGLM